MLKAPDRARTVDTPTKPMPLLRGMAALAGAALLFVPGVAGSSSAAFAQQPANTLVGKVYQGVLASRIIPPRGSGQRAQSNHGSATAVLEATGAGKAQLILSGTLVQDGDASFVAAGQFDGNRWVGHSETFELSIAPDGTVRGNGTFQGQPTSFDGTYSDNDLELLVEITVPRSTSGGFAAGTQFQFKYDLRHFPPSARRSGGSAAGGCKEVVYRLKLTPNLFGSGLSSVRVPECRR